MRMWGVDPEKMCTKHLLGEHVEMHMFVGTINKGVSIQGYVDKGLVDTTKIKERHDALVVEMTRRGMNHKSPLEYQDRLSLGSVDIRESHEELINRCASCKR